jgi:hypothetical protein
MTVPNEDFTALEVYLEFALVAHIQLGSAHIARQAARVDTTTVVQDSFLFRGCLRISFRQIRFEATAAANVLVPPTNRVWNVCCTISIYGVLFVHAGADDHPMPVRGCIDGP